MRVVFFAPIIPGLFFEVVAQVMRVAAEQLGVELDCVDGSLGPPRYVERGLALADRTPRPDYVIIVNFVGTAPKIARGLGEAGISTLVAFESLSTGELSDLEQPRCPGYLGTLVPDDVEAGRLLAEILVTEARRRKLTDSSGTIQVGILSSMQSQASTDRFRGWLKFRDGTPNVLQSGLGIGGADEKGLQSAARNFLTRTPATSVLWCFNDAIALGARTIAIEMGRKPGEDILIGGVDLLDRALVAVRDGGLFVSLGGHVVDGVRALLLLIEHQETGSPTKLNIVTKMSAVMAADAPRYIQFMKEEAWRKADFARFSHRHRRGGPVPEFSLRALVEA